MRGTITIKGGWPADWRTRLPKKFSHCCEGSEPHIRFPSLEIQQRAWEPPENLPLKTKGFDYKTVTGLGETEIPVLEGSTKPCLNQDSEEKSRRVNQNTCWCCRVSCGGTAWQGFTTGMGEPVWEGPLWHKPSWQSPLMTQPVNLRSGSPQAKRNTRKGPQSHLSSVARSCPTL